MYLYITNSVLGEIVEKKVIIPKGYKKLDEIGICPYRRFFFPDPTINLLSRVEIKSFTEQITFLTEEVFSEYVYIYKRFSVSNFVAESEYAIREKQLYYFLKRLAPKYKIPEDKLLTQEQMDMIDRTIKTNNAIYELGYKKCKEWREQKIKEFDERFGSHLCPIEY